MSIQHRSSKVLIGIVVVPAILLALPESSLVHTFARNRVFLPIIGGVDSMLDYIQDGKNYNDPNNHPLFQKSPNWFPISKSEIRDDTALELELVEGKLPPDLDGVALRVGPNADTDNGFNKKLNAIIDGDGMLHSIRLDGREKGNALYSSGWIETPRRKFEQHFGRAFFLRLGEMKGICGLFKIFLMPFKIYIFGKSEIHVGQANTALVKFSNRVYALQENSLPFEIDLKENGSFKSIGYQDFHGVLNYPFGAHPRVDPESGEMFFSGYSPFMKPALKLGSVSPFSPSTGEPATVTRYFDVESPSGGIPFSHDFAITKNYMLLIDNSIRFDFNNVLKGEVLKLDDQSALRFGICLRNSTSADDIVWYSHERALAVLHFVNAWEEDDGKIILWAPLWKNFVADVVNINDDPSDLIRMTEFVFDLNDPQRRIKTREVENNAQRPTAIDFPAVNSNFVGRKSECAFAGILQRNVFDFDGISKWRTVADASGGLEKNIYYGNGITGGEPIIAPKIGRGEYDSCAVYVMSLIHDAKSSKSYLVIYDGEDLNDTPVAKILMPHRVPSGLHAMWVDAGALSRDL